MFIGTTNIHDIGMKFYTHTSYSSKRKNKFLNKFVVCTYTQTVPREIPL